MLNARSIFRLLLAAAVSLTILGRAHANDQVTLRINFAPLPGNPGVANQAALAVFNAFFRKHPNYKCEYASGLQLPEGLGEAQQMMAFAGGQAPDVFNMSIRQIQNYIRLGLICPLDKLIAKQKAEHPHWHLPGKEQGITKYHWDAARGDDGKLYALVNNYWILTLWYRRDLFEQAGIIPPRPPKTWKEYFDFAQRLTFPNKTVRNARFQAGQYGTYISTGYTAGYIFTNFVYQAGGDMTLQRRVCPYDGTVNEFKKEDDVCRCRTCGRSLMDQPRTWILAYGRKPGQEALAFYKKLRWTEWTRCPRCGTPNNLPVVKCPKCGELNPVRTSANYLYCRVCGTRIPIPPKLHHFVCKKCGYDLSKAPVYTGVVRVGGDGRDMFLRGEIAMMINSVEPEDIDTVITKGGLRPDQIGFGPPPAGPGGKPYVLTGGTAWCINSQVAKDPKKLQAAWDYIVFMCSDEALRITTSIYVRGGYSYLVRPQVLKRLGYDVEYEDYDPTFRKAMEDAPKYGRIQPHDLHYQHVEGTELAIPIDTLVYPGGEHKNPATLIKTSMNDANEKLYRIIPPQVQRRRRFWGTLFFCVVAPLVLLGFYLITRERAPDKNSLSRETFAAGSQGLRRRNTIIAWMLLLPALATVILWQYVPLLRGTVMAFYNYRLFGGSKFIGLDNFIEVLTSPDFWNSVRATALYVTISLSIGFVAPIALAMLLHEAPWAKMFFRTVFYLPAVTTGLVIMFLWKMFYAATPQGLLNRIAMPVLHLLHVVGPEVQYIDWLHTPGLAMFCVVLPGVWAGAGPGSLIYLAALKTVPEDLYEAIAIDGGSIIHKLRMVTFPALRPLILINFIGAFIGSFHAMQNVFVMTGGGPANSTMVLGIHIWVNAFLYLRFGYATAMAWVLGSILIGFTVLQLRILKRVEFRAAGNAG